MTDLNNDRVYGVVTSIRDSYGMAAVTIDVGLGEVVEYVTPKMVRRCQLEPGAAVAMRILKSTLVIDDRSA